MKASASNLACRPPAPRGRRFPDIGLRANPFRVLEPGELVQTLIEPALLERAAEWLASDTAVIEIVGERGWGKSTHLDVLRHVGAQRSDWQWHSTYVPPDATRVAWPPACDVWCIDEAQRISQRQQARIVTSAGQGRFRLVVGTHVSLRPMCDASGVSCRSIELRAVDAGNLRRFIERRVEAAALIPDAGPATSAQAVELLQRYATGNLRTVEELLYEVYQSAAESGQLTRRITAEDVESAARAVNYAVS